MRGGAAVARRAHNPKVAGSIPAPATNYFIAYLLWCCTCKRHSTNYRLNRLFAHLTNYPAANLLAIAHRAAVFT